MTRDKALQAAQLLNDIDAFQQLLVEVDVAFDKVDDIYDITGKKELYIKVMTMMEALVERKKKSLEEL